MRSLFFRSALLFSLLLAAVFANSTPTPPNPFATSAKFSVDNTTLTFSSAVAVIEPRRGAPGYSWLRIHFYPFALTADDISAAQKGDISFLDNKAGRNSGNPDLHNRSVAVIQLSVDQASKVWQVDMAIPGHGCTIAPFPDDIQSFLQTYSFDGKTLRLRSKGSHTCDLTSVNAGKQLYSWDFDFTLPVSAAAKK